MRLYQTKYSTIVTSNPNWDWFLYPIGMLPDEVYWKIDKLNAQSFGWIYTGDISLWRNVSTFTYLFPNTVMAFIMNKVSSIAQNINPKIPPQTFFWLLVPPIEMVGYAGFRSYWRMALIGLTFYYTNRTNTTQILLAKNTYPNHLRIHMRRVMMMREKNNRKNCSRYCELGGIFFIENCWLFI